MLDEVMYEIGAGDRAGSEGVVEEVRCDKVQS